MNKKHKAAVKSYLRAVAASGITVALAIVADIHPAYATLLGAVVAPLIKAVYLLTLACSSHNKIIAY